MNKSKLIKKNQSETVISNPNNEDESSCLSLYYCEIMTNSQESVATYFAEQFGPQKQLSP